MEGGQAGVMTIGSKRVLAITVNADKGFVRTSKQALNIIRNNIMLVFCRQESKTQITLNKHGSYILELLCEVELFMIDQVEY